MNDVEAVYERLLKKREDPDVIQNAAVKAVTTARNQPDKVVQYPSGVAKKCLYWARCDESENQSKQVDTVTIESLGGLASAPQDDPRSKTEHAELMRGVLGKLKSLIFKHADRCPAKAAAFEAALLGERYDRCASIARIKGANPADNFRKWFKPRLDRLTSEAELVITTLEEQWLSEFGCLMDDDEA